MEIEPETATTDALTAAALRLQRLRERARQLHSQRLPTAQRVQLLRALEAAWLPTVSRYRAAVAAADEVPPAADASPSRAHWKR